MDHGTMRDASKKTWMCTWRCHYLHCTNGVYVRNGGMEERGRWLISGRGGIGRT